jgi:hypothetical protein
MNPTRVQKYFAPISLKFSALEEGFTRVGARKNGGHVNTASFQGDTVKS